MPPEKPEITASSNAAVNSWKQVRLTLPFEKAVQPFQSAVAAVRVAINATLTFVNILKNFLIAIPDPLVAPIIAACEALKKIIDDLLAYNQVHMLIVLPRENLGQLDNLTLDKTLSPLVTGGNAHFLGTVLESLDDPLDDYRPQFEPTDYVAGAVIFMGTKTYLELLPAIQRLMQLLSGTKLRFPISIPIYNIRIQNLKARVFPGTTKDKLTVRLTWDALDTLVLVNNNVVDKLSYLTLTRTSPNDAVEQQFKIPAPETTTYHDTSAEPGKYYIYTLRAHLQDSTVVAQNSVSIALPSDTGRFLLHTDEGIPPNWYAAPGLLYYFPAVVGLLNDIYAFIDRIQKSFKSPLDEYKAYIEQVADNIEESGKKIDAMLAEVQSILSLLEIPDTVFIGVYPFLSPGGNDGLRNTLQVAFTNFGDPNRPPFDAEEDVAAGVVFVTGSKSATSIQQFIDTIQTFMQPIPNSPTFSSAYRQLESSLDNVISAAEQEIEHLFGQLNEG